MLFMIFEQLLDNWFNYDTLFVPVYIHERKGDIIHIFITNIIELELQFDNNKTKIGIYSYG